MSDVSNIEARNSTVRGIGSELLDTMPCIEPSPAAPSLRLDFDRTRDSLPVAEIDPEMTSQRLAVVPPAEKPLGIWLVKDLRATPIQIWEGVVTGVDEDAASMSATLTAKMGSVPQHSADISLDWVHPQDLSLVRPGAVFYWTLYKETKRGTISNSQELRFRRRPYWSDSQIVMVQGDARELAKRLRK